MEGVFRERQRPRGLLQISAADAVVRGPEETPYHAREVTIEDPDGFTLVFSEPVDTSRSFEDVMGIGFEE